uniref:EGF-like domain-containing protein n=1 Tax=Arion vulgaris TaxID=1028688 RepID=A0A0B6YX16_9EUPU
MHRANCRLILATLILCFVYTSDGCGRTPARTKPAETTPIPAERKTTTQSSEQHPHSSNRLECTEEEIKEAACLNGGVCFVLDYLYTRNAHCQCSEIWTGTRCEEVDDRVYVFSADKVEKAGIAAGVVVLIIIVTVVIVYLVVKKRKKRKERAEANGSSNGHAGKALMGCDKMTFESEDGEKCTDV